jgi:DMSO/TMAO reductase YedYZ heme-binding membrane subunit
MIYLITTIPLVLYAFFFYKFIRKYEFYHYGVTAIIALAFGLVEGHNFFNEGFLGVTFFIIVMFTGVLTKSILKQRLNQVRAQYAIIGFIFISGHAIPYLSYLLDEGLVFAHSTIIIGIICYVIFVPLFITSFMIIRKRMTFRQWKSVHQFAYASYILIFVHLLLINNSRQLFYIVLLSIYVVLKTISLIEKYYIKRQIKQKLMKL